jgi:hypothetical protein
VLAIFGCNYKKGHWIMLLTVLSRYVTVLIFARQCALSLTYTFLAKSASSNLLLLRSLPRCVFSTLLLSRRICMSKARRKGTGDCFRPYLPDGGSIKPSAWTCCLGSTFEVRSNLRKSHSLLYSVREQRYRLLAKRFSCVVKLCETELGVKLRLTL